MDSRNQAVIRKLNEVVAMHNMVALIEIEDAKNQRELTKNMKLGTGDFKTFENPDSNMIIEVRQPEILDEPQRIAEHGDYDTSMIRMNNDHQKQRFKLHRTNQSREIETEGYGAALRRFSRTVSESELPDRTDRRKVVGGFGHRTRSLSHRTVKYNSPWSTNRYASRYRNSNHSNNRPWMESQELRIESRYRFVRQNTARDYEQPSSSSWHEDLPKNSDSNINNTETYHSHTSCMSKRYASPLNNDKNIATPSTTFTCQKHLSGAHPSPLHGATCTTCAAQPDSKKTLVLRNTVQNRFIASGLRSSECKIEFR